MASWQPETNMYDRRVTRPHIFSRFKLQPMQSSNISSALSSPILRSPLHLPTSVLAHTPISSPRLSKDILPIAPAIPAAWLWHCPLCNTVYNLGVTRRCLEDGSIFSPSGNLYHERKWPRDPIGRQNGRSKRRRQQPVLCRTRFDHSCWGQYNRWRRGGLRNNAGKHSIARSEERRGQRDCCINCDYPLECHHSHLQSSSVKRRKTESLIPKLMVRRRLARNRRDKLKRGLREAIDALNAISDRVNALLSSKRETTLVSWKARKEGGGKKDIGQAEGETTKDGDNDPLN